MPLRLLSVLLASLVTATSLNAQIPAEPDSAFWAGFRWRSIGPANMSGRVTDIEGVPGTKTFFFAAASGGIWKTINNGTTFRPVFDDERVVAMGDLAIAPGDPEIVWAGTGEEDSRNSISPGGGVYKSVDGGLTWELMGLEETRVVGRIVVDPRDANTVFVAALGHIWGPNEERGLYKTTDGGESWRKVKHISEKAGFVDVAMHPENPDILFASSWERVRGPWFLESGGPGSALWKSTDGGETWTEVVGGGFPETMKGRIGLAIAHSDPDVMYAVVEAEKDDAVNGLDEEEAATSGLMGSGLYRSEDGGRTWRFMNDKNSRPFYYSQVRVDPSDPDVVIWSSTPVQISKDGGKTVGTATLGVHVDHHALWWDPEDPDHFVVGNDGGIAVTWDKGGTYDFPNTMALGQFYHVSYSMEIPYRVCGGLQDNGTWCAPSRRSSGGIDNHMWFTIHGGDGFYTAQHPRNPELVYAESQGGNISLVNLATGERTGLEKPDWQERTRALADTVVLLEEEHGEDPPEEVARRLESLKARIAADSAALDLRWNWSTPFLLSPHDPEVFYAGANRVMRAVSGGMLVPVSPDLTYADTTKIRVSTRTTGGLTPDVTGAETHATIVALAESPLVEGMLFAGTDDGRVWRTRPGGGDWTELTGRFAGVPEGTWVSRIEPSHHDADRFYVSFDGHRSDDFTPYVYVTDDGGRSFRSVSGDLPRGKPDFVHVVREDPVNPDLLYVGTDVGAYVSLDRGRSWRRFMEGLPTVPVHDLKVHPRDRELIAATHGRSIWIVDVAPLQELGRVRLADEPVLFQPKPGLQYGDPPVGGESTGHEWFEGESPEYGAEIAYWVPEGAVPEVVAAESAEEADEKGTGAEGPARISPEERRAAMRERMQSMSEEERAAMRERFQNMSPEERRAVVEERMAALPPDERQMAAWQARRAPGPRARVAILSLSGDTIRSLEGSAAHGLHRVHWNFRGERREAEPLSPSQRRDSLEMAQTLRAIADSLVEVGVAEKAVLDRLLSLVQSGNRQALFRMFERGGRRGGGAREWVERPGESYPSGEMADVGRPDMRGIMYEVFSAVRARGMGYGALFRGRRGGPAPLVDPGEYRVVVKVGDHEIVRPLRVVRAEGYEPWEGQGFPELEF